MPSRTVCCAPSIVIAPAFVNVPLLTPKLDPLQPVELKSRRPCAPTLESDFRERTALPFAQELSRVTVWVPLDPPSVSECAVLPKLATVTT